MKSEELSQYSRPFRKAFDLMQRAMSEIGKCDEDEKTSFFKIVKKKISDKKTIKQPPKPDYRTRQFITLFTQGVSPYEIAQRWRVDSHTVLRALTKYGYLTEKPQTEEIE